MTFFFEIGQLRRNKIKFLWIGLIARKTQRPTISEQLRVRLCVILVKSKHYTDTLLYKYTMAIKRKMYYFKRGRLRYKTKLLVTFIYFQDVIGWCFCVFQLFRLYVIVKRRLTEKNRFSREKLEILLKTIPTRRSRMFSVFIEAVFNKSDFSFTRIL